MMELERKFGEVRVEGGRWRRLRSGRPFLVGACFAGAAALAGGCNNNSSSTGPAVPTGTVSITSPAGGEAYQAGDNVAVVWSCTDCANVPAGDYMQVFAFDGANSYLVVDSAQLSDSVEWVAGSTLQNVTLLPGIYLLLVQDAAGAYQAQSRFFQLAAAP